MLRRVTSPALDYALISGANEARRRRRTSWGWITAGPIGLAYLALGCGGTAPGGAIDDPTASSAQAIYGGTVDDDGLANIAVVALRIDRDAQSFELCSGALIAPGVVLTAHHCVGSDVAASVGCDQNGLSTSGVQVGPDVAPSTLHVFVGAHPNVQFGTADANVTAIYDTAGSTLCNSDLALVVLDRPLASIPPLRVRLSAETHAGESIRAVGYGQNDVNAPTGTRLRRDGIAVKAVGSLVSASGTPLGSNELEVGASTCVGDSGGPAISEETGAIIGVVSRAGSCTDDFGHVYTMTSGFAELITRVLEAAGQQPLGEVIASDGAAPSPAPVPSPTPVAPAPGAADAGAAESNGSSSHGPVVYAYTRASACSLAPGERTSWSTWLPLFALAAAAVARRVKRT